MARVDFGVLFNSETCRFHLNNFKDHDSKEWGVYSDPTYFLKFKHPKNVAVLHWPYPADPAFGEIVEQVYNDCDQIFIIITEVHRPAIEFMQTYDRDKIVYYIAGSVTVPLQYAKLQLYHDWFHTSSFFYREYLPEILHRIDYKNKKDRAFDILLGRKKPHRDFAYNYIQENLRDSDYIMRYFNNVNPILLEDEDHWTFEHRGVRSNGPAKWTVETVEYYGHKISMSQVLPIEIYNSTAYSLVAETNTDNYYTFFTEKTAKPIIARRLFIMLAGCGYLAELRNLGFRTFDGIIDETYDTIENHTERYEAAMKQVEWLCQQNQTKILKKVMPIVEHNFTVMMTTNWYHNFNHDLESRIGSLAEQTRR
jgi:hypothetical protein